MASKALKFPYVTQPQKEAQGRERKHGKEDGCCVSSAFSKWAVRSLWLQFPTCEKRNCRNNCRTHSSSSLPRHFNDSSVGNYRLYSRLVTQFVCAPRSVQCQVTWVPWTIISSNLGQPSWIYPEIFKAVIYQTRLICAAEEEVNVNRKMVRQTFPITIDISKFLDLAWHHSSFFQEQRGCGNFQVVWAVGGCRTQLSNEITLLLFVPTSLERKELCVILQHTNYIG